MTAVVPGYPADACGDEPSPAGFVPATLAGLRPCPARPDYVELHFTTPEGTWNWCFPRPVRRKNRPPAPIALTLGPYSVVARRVGRDGLGAALPPAIALPMILAGAEVIVARALVVAGR
jgi:hypothetical protein